jgi:hypothetical protein
MMIGSLAIAAIGLGTYGLLLPTGQERMEGSRLRPLICVGIAYLAVAVVVPGLLLSTWGEAGQFTLLGSMWSFAAGVTGALGALGVGMALNFGGRPSYVRPLVFAGAPVVNTLATIGAHRGAGQIGPLFYSGLILLIVGSVAMLVFAPKGPEPAEKAGS